MKVSCRGAAFLVVLAFLSGCFSPPRRVSAPGRGAPATATSVQGQGSAKVDEAAMTVDCWTRSGNVLPTAALGKGRRVVVTDFDVELVDYQFQLPTPRQVRFKPLPISPNPVHLALRLVGVTRRSSELDEEAQGTLAADLYRAFVDDLRSRGLEVVPPETLQASPTYAGISNVPIVRSSPFMLLNARGSDMGVVLHTRTVAAPGLSVLQANPHQRGAADMRIVEETRADVAVAVRLRVGTFREQPALEHRSVVRLTTREGSTTLRASHSLVSDASAIDQARFRPFIGRVETIEPGVFGRELMAMLPRFVAPALSEPGL